VGLLAGMNDQAEAARTSDGRDINRHNYSIQEIDREVQRPIVRNILKLIRFRNSHPAFNGAFYLDHCSDHEISLMWRVENTAARLYINLNTSAIEIRYDDELTNQEKILSFA